MPGKKSLTNVGNDGKDGNKTDGGKDSEPVDIAELIRGFELRLDQKFAAQSQQIEEVKTQLGQQISDIKTLAEENKKAIAFNTIETAKATQVANTNKQDLSDLSLDVNASIEELQKSNRELKKEVTSLHNTVAIQAVKMKVQRVRTEDQTNRALRKTIIIRGIPEPNEEKTWDNTCTAASNAIAEASGSRDTDASTSIANLLERIHRGGKYTPGSQYPRKIHAVLYDWNDIAKLRKNLIATAYGRNSGIYIDNHYGPDTTYRRGLAGKKRRELIDSNTIAQGYVAFPAKLYVKYKRTDSKYTVFHDFSNERVTLREEEQYEHEELFESD